MARLRIPLFDQLVSDMPRDHDELLNIVGIGPYICDKFGIELLQLVNIFRGPTVGGRVLGRAQIAFAAAAARRNRNLQARRRRRRNRNGNGNGDARNGLLVNHLRVRGQHAAFKPAEDRAILNGVGIIGTIHYTQRVPTPWASIKTMHAEALSSRSSKQIRNRYCWLTESPESVSDPLLLGNMHALIAKYGVL